jgi:predicted enzyme related to lactoylglutathione lyase
MAFTVKTAPSPSIWNENQPTRPGESSFYTQLFGWTTTNVDMGPMGTYAMFQQSSPNVGGIVRVQSPEWDGLPPHWSVYVQVDNVDARALKAEELGGKVCVPPFDIPNVGRACIVLDPEGASFYLFTPRCA